ncbi:MAG TPA: helix-turn-helix domain-containing protein [Steroidobacteraceae bacterium]|nr:helix-turn-helix domain-containing protein [Steroidobacteraceae bacterium]
MSSARTAQRAIGRPPRIAGIDARESLLDAAVELFAENGVAGTPIAAIAARAGVTPAMVHYYFRNRDQLLDAVAGERLLRIVSGVWTPVAACKELEPMLRGLVQRIVQAAEVNPWLPSLWLREVVSEGGQLRARLVRFLRLELIQHLISTVAAAQRRGEISAEIEPRLVPVSVLGLTLLPLANLRLLQQVPLLRGVGRKDIGRHAEALLASAFAKAPRRRALSR